MKVIILEKNRIGLGTSMRTTGFLTQIIDTASEDVCKIITFLQAFAST